jgi:hypothetical protein
MNDHVNPAVAGPDELQMIEFMDRIEALESALWEIVDGCEEPAVRAKEALGYADVPPGDSHYEGEPLDPDDPCSPRMRVIEGEEWTSSLAHDLGSRYALGNALRLMGIYCKRCGRLWTTTEVQAS